MARKEAINTFSDGLVLDLNPINTPNTVLTDCLNGTLITYDGNEQSLQNDKGNYPLKDCKLPANYIPVGVKEYGDILYIVSYNPITNHVQIGSYPSPETIFDEFDIQGNDSTASTYDNNLKYTVSSLWNQIAESPYNGIINYSELAEVLEILKLFYGSVPENYKINPGDKYKIAITNGAANNPSFINNLDLQTFEGIEFYIFDENRKPYDITKDIEINTQNHIYTNWKIPGYLATKLRFAQVDDFKVNVRKIIVPTYHVQGQSAVKELSLNFQYFISDYLYNDHINAAKDALKIKIEIFDQNGSKGDPIIWSINDTVDLKNNTICYYSNWTMENVSFNSNDIITLIITPFVQYTNKKVFYDKFKRTLTFDLSQKGNVSDFEIGEGIWRYTVDDQLTLYFDTIGIQESSVMSEDVELQYKIKRIAEFANQAAVQSWIENNTGWNTVYDWNVIGDTILKIDFDAWTGIIESGKIYAEDYYRIAFRFIDPNSNGVLRSDITKTILATELLNGNSAKKYDKIYFDEWINNYSNHIKNKSITISANIDQNSITTDPLVQYDETYNNWYYNSELDDYPTYINYTKINSDNGIPSFNVSSELKFNTNISYGSDIELLKGPLWNNLTSQLNYTDTKSTNINSSTGKVVDATVSASSVGSVKKTLNYKLIQQAGPDRIVAIESTDLNVPKEEDIKITADGLYEDKISKKGLPTPDLEITINGFPADTYIVSSKTYNISTATKLLGMFNDKDVLFCTLEIPNQVRGDDTNPNNDNHNVLKFKTGEDLEEGGYVYAAADGTTTSNTYYAVFKYPARSSEDQTKLLFVRVGNLSGTNNNITSSSASVHSAYVFFENWASRIKHRKGLGYSIIGNFYKAEQSTSSTRIPTVVIEAAPILNCSSWTFNSCNMFDTIARSNISDNDNFFKLSDTSNNIDLFSGISLEKGILEIPYDGSTESIDSVLSQVQQNISDRNSLVESNIISWNADTFIRAHSSESDENINEYYYETTSLNANDGPLLQMLNKTWVCDTPVMFLTSDNWFVSGYGHNLPYRYTQLNYIGIAQIDIAIT